MRILLKNGLIVTSERERILLSGYDILIEDKYIKKIDQNLSSFETDKIIDCTDQIIMPGLINCHTHTPMTLMRNVADDVSLHEWLFENMFKIEEHIDGRMCYYGAMLSFIEMIKTGTTTFNDMYSFIENIIEAAKKIKLRGVVSRGLIGDTGMDVMDERLKNNLDLYEQYKEDELIQVHIAPHAIYTSTENYLEKALHYAKEYKLPIHTHLSETKKEVDDCIRERGVTPVSYLNRLGYFDHKTILAHMVHVTDEDIEILKEKKDVSVVHNPASNMKLGSGIADIVSYLEKGLNVCMGTDGAGSNNTLDLFKDIRLASYIQKGLRQDPTVLKVEEAICMLTVNGAKALGFNNLGMIKEGYLADIILLDMNKSYYYPRTNPLSQLIYSTNGEDVGTVIINGEIIMEDRKILTIDEEEVKRGFTEEFNRLMKLYKG